MSKKTNTESLEDVLQRSGNIVDFLRNSQLGPNVYPVVPPEYTNWRDEQRAWRETCILFNQSYHMTDMYVEGPDALKLLTKLGINTFNNFAVNKAKQFVPCNYDGHVIGDVILFHLDEQTFNLVGRPSVHNWVQFHAETGDYDVKLRRDERSIARKDPEGREVFRYQVQGPNAAKLMEKVVGKAMPEIKFFNMDWVKIAGRKVRALRHGMVGQPGWELFGPYQDGEAVKDAIVEAGQEFGLRLSGARTYSSNTLESGWIPSPMPAVYTGDRMKAFREWLPGDGFEARQSIGGSFYSENIEDYYLTPHDLGYGSLIKFDHDFIGREALEAMQDKPHRKKVTLALNGEDVERTIGSMFREQGNAKFMDWPSAVYAMLPYDKVTRDGKTIGISTWCGYSFNERKMLTLAMLEAEYAETGTEVVFVWGEEGGGTSKPTVEPHVQTEIRATVAPAPYVEFARTAYRKN
ncbi:MAG: aminomethyltransferase family protein [Woeseiaceae bacterium]|nr:aminomethyltransferase family protein [Woeseiaceae bacterium]